MWKPDWRKAAWYAGAGLVLLVVLSGSILANIGYEDRQNTERAQEAAREERQAIAALLDDPREQAIATETGERRRGEREQSDLEAQWATAGGTIAQAVFGLLGLAGLVATVFYARRAAKHTETELSEARLEEIRQSERFTKQLSTAREQLDEARRIGRQQVRAYLSISDATASFSTLDLKNHVGPNCRLTIKVKNSGQSPARNVRCTARVVWKHGEKTGEAQRKIRVDPIPAGTEELATVFVTCSDIEELAELPGYAITELEVYLTLTGLDVFDDPVDEASVYFWFNYPTFHAGKSMSETVTLNRRNSVNET